MLPRPHSKIAKFLRGGGGGKRSESFLCGGGAHARGRMFRKRPISPIAFQQIELGGVGRPWGQLTGPHAYVKKVKGENFTLFSLIEMGNRKEQRWVGND